MVYGSARPSYIKQLDPIHNQALRLCLGAFKTSPVESLCVEAQEAPLCYRREKLALQYALKLKSNPDNPAHDLVFKHRYRQAFLRKPSAIPSFNIRIRQLFRQAGIEVDNIAENSVPDHPPWEAEVPGPGSTNDPIAPDPADPERSDPILGDPTESLLL